MKLASLIVGRLKAAWRSRYSVRIPVKDQLLVTFDDTRVTIKVIRDLDESWNQTFNWNDVRRICVQDGGMWGSDMVYVSLTGSGETIAVPTEAAGGSEFYKAFRERGLFPDEVAVKAIRETEGRTHCWPPEDVD